jgi:ankyrin repeat protein
MLIAIDCSVSAACVNDREEMLRFLVEHGADLNLVSKSRSCTPLQTAAERNNLPLVKLLLELGADLNGLCGEHGSTIHYVLRSKDKSTIRFFLDNGVKVIDGENQSSLHKALFYGIEILVPELLRKGAEVNQRQGGRSALGQAFMNKDEETVQLLLQHGASFSEFGTESFLDAVTVMPLDDIKRLLDGGMDPNCHSMHKTALGVS